MLNTLIVVWRESLEAMLVIGVLLAWIARQPESPALKRGLWLGVVAGIALAAALGYVTFVAQSQFAGQSLDIFQLAMVLFAAALIFQMVLWMRRHGRQMKQQLETHAEHASGIFGVGAIAALAVAREGTETVVFVYGLGLQSGGAQLLGLLAAALAGFALAVATAWLVARGARFLNYRTLFAISEVLLLLIGGALLVNGVDRLIALDWLPPLLDPAWDSSALIDDAAGVGRLLASFIGYRARPAGVVVLAVAAYWSFALWQLNRKSQGAEQDRFGR
jgi:high-affinity iron transporter